MDPDSHEIQAVNKREERIDIMGKQREIDCIVVGYNELPFAEYENLLRQYGEDSEAYRDFNLSFAEAGGEKRLYGDLMNYATGLAGGQNGGAYPEVFRSGDIPNLAAAYLTNFLNRRGHRTRYVNLFQSEKARLADMLKQKPYCIALTTTFYVLNFPVIDMVKYIRKLDSEVKIVVGGPLVSNHVRNYAAEDLESALTDMGADIWVVESQGELALSRIVECLKQGGDLSRVPNLFYRESSGSLRQTLPEPEQNVMDENYIDWMELAKHHGGDLGRTLQTRTARSCAFSCAFCNYPTRAGKLSLTSIDVLEREFDSMRELGVENVVFIDDTFNVPIRRFKDLCRMLIRKEYNFNWFSYFRCSNSDEEAIDLAAQSGCKGVFLGIESGSPKILTNMNKKATIEKYAQGIEQLHNNGVITFGSFISGFPGETQDTIQETNAFIANSSLDYYRVQLWYNEHGTPIHQQKDKYGIEGDGFVWSHNDMDSMEAMDSIERTFLTIDNAAWLPQWSFDFWIIPYLMGKGVDLEDFRSFVGGSRRRPPAGGALSGQLRGGLTRVSPGQSAARSRRYGAFPRRPSRAGINSAHEPPSPPGFHRPQLHLPRRRPPRRRPRRRRDRARRAQYSHLPRWRALPTAAHLGRRPRRRLARGHGLRHRDPDPL